MTPLFLNFQRAWQSDWSLRLECFHQTIDGIALDCCDKVISSNFFALFLDLSDNARQNDLPLFFIRTVHVVGLMLILLRLA